MGDLSPRARAALESADVVVAEDTRVTGRLLALLGVSKTMVRVDEHASPGTLERVIASVKSGLHVVVVSDAGTPVVSDPGAALGSLAIEHGVTLDSIPGPSAVSNALVLSGFFAQRYVFLGYLPRKIGEIRDVLEPFATSTMTVVAFESAHRVAKFLQNANEVLGDRKVAICREMTKMHQETIRLRLTEYATLKPDLKGEVTVVIEGWRRRRAFGG